MSSIRPALFSPSTPVVPGSTSSTRFVNDLEKHLAHGRQKFKAIPQAEVAEVTRADLILQEGRESPVLLDEPMLPIYPLAFLREELRPQDRDPARQTLADELGAEAIF